MVCTVNKGERLRQEDLKLKADLATQRDCLKKNQVWWYAPPDPFERLRQEKCHSETLFEEEERQGIS